MNEKKNKNTTNKQKTQCWLPPFWKEKKDQNTQKVTENAFQSGDTKQDASSRKVLFSQATHIISQKQETKEMKRQSRAQILVDRI